MPAIKTCDLCGGAAFRALVRLPQLRAMRSDRAVVPSHLAKAECDTCGLVCDAGGELVAGETYYRDEYGIALTDHVFYTGQGSRLRSEVFADWILDALSRSGVAAEGVTAVAEIGAGAGFLLSVMADRLPTAHCGGFELSAAAVTQAERSGRPVIHGDLSGVPEHAFDLVYAVAVLEHVPSPAAFLSEIKRVIRPGGHLVLVQPTQDVESYDVFFVDHLFHFGSAHLAGYARKLGFDELAVDVGHALMPNFSLHVWAEAGVPPSWQWRHAPARTTCESTIGRVVGDMGRLDATLDQLAARHRGLAVFGLHEVFALAQAYSSLHRRTVQCGFDDQPARPELARLPFPVTIPERYHEYPVTDVLLTMNKIYYQQAAARLRGLGLVPHPVLS